MYCESCIKAVKKLLKSSIIASLKMVKVIAIVWVEEESVVGWSRKGSVRHLAVMK